MLFVIIQKEIVSDVLKKISKTHFEFFFFSPAFFVLHAERAISETQDFEVEDVL